MKQIILKRKRQHAISLLVFVLLTGLLMPLQKTYSQNIHNGKRTEGMIPDVNWHSENTKTYASYAIDITALKRAMYFLELINATGLPTATYSVRVFLHRFRYNHVSYDATKRLIYKTNLIIGELIGTNHILTSSCRILIATRHLLILPCNRFCTGVCLCHQ